MFPVYLCPSRETVSAVRLHFTYNNAVWEPAWYNKGDGDVDYDLPTQRLPARDAFGYSAHNPGSNEVRVYNINELRINAVGATAAASWGHHPDLNLAEGNLEPLIWLPFICTGDVSQSASLGVTVVTASIVVSGTPYTQAVYEWNGSLPVSEEVYDAQAVDWCIKGERLELPDRGQGRIRGLFLRHRSLGEPASIATRFGHGLLNATFQTDWREWSSQLADYTMGLAVSEKASVRSRMLGVAAAVNKRTFGNVATWSSTASTSTGNFLIDDEQVDTRAVSLTARGETLSVMLFGHVRDKAQALIVDGLDMVVRQVGQIRRWGR